MPQAAAQAIGRGGEETAERTPAPNRGVGMGTRTTRYTPPDTYFALVKEFALIPIQSDAHLDAAMAMIDRLLQEEPDEGVQAYLDVLTGLVESYEAEHVPVGDASEADVLRELMRSNGLTQSELARRSRISRSTLSAVLTGARTRARNGSPPYAQASIVSAPAGARRAAVRRRGVARSVRWFRINDRRRPCLRH